MISTRNLTLNSTPVEVTIDGDIDSPNSLCIQNTSLAKFVYVGGDSVSTTNYGYKLSPNQAITMDLAPYDKIHIMGDSGATAAILILDQP